MRGAARPAGVERRVAEVRAETSPTHGAIALTSTKTRR